jgi:hypothetical protein
VQTAAAKSSIHDGGMKSIFHRKRGFGMRGNLSGSVLKFGSAALWMAGLCELSAAQSGPPPFSTYGPPPPGVTQSPYSAGRGWGNYGTPNHGAGWAQPGVPASNTYTSNGWGQYGATGWQPNDTGGWIRYGYFGRGYYYTYNPETGLYQYYGTETTQQRNRYDPTK